MRRTIAKAFGLDAATRRDPTYPLYPSHVPPFSLASRGPAAFPLASTDDHAYNGTAALNETTLEAAET